MSSSIPRDYYYIECWQDGRKREQIKERAEVIDRGCRKALELETNRAGIETVQEIGSPELYQNLTFDLLLFVSFYFVRV
jgi:hypothetical protein